MRYMGFVNLTPFAAEPLLLADERGRDLFTCVVKGTFALAPNGDHTAVMIADEQLPVCIAPVYNGDPELSSLKYESETVPVKLGTDVVLIGHAHDPVSHVTWLDVSFSVGSARCTARVFGNRVWTSVLGKWVATEPEPFDAMPIVYERAFGGWDRTSPDPSQHECDPRNPVGMGFISKKHGNVTEGMPLPNVENPYDPITGPMDRPAPVGFGFLGAHWYPRTRYAGTYDAAWQRNRMPLLPDDFDRRFYNAANPQLTFQGFLGGDEPVEILNASNHGPLRFALPRFEPVTTMRMKDGTTRRVRLALDTVVVNTDIDRLLLVWRGSILIERGPQDILWVKAHIA